MRTPRSVLGRDVLEEVWGDMRVTELPSWMSSAPPNWGTAARGKLTADQWMVICTVHLPITLIRIWGKLRDRRFSLLCNFMDLTSSVQLADQRAINEGMIRDSEMLMLRYLNTMKTLFKDTKIQPIHHAALHAGEFLRYFGPNHSVRAFGGERYLGVLGLQNVNNKSGLSFCTSDMTTSNSAPGELEATFMTSVCRSSNLQALVETSNIPGQAEPLLTAYRSVVNEDHRGTHLADEDHHPPTKPPRSELLDDECYQLLLHMLNKKFGTAEYTSGDDQTIPVARHVQQLAKVSIRGVVYAHAKSLPRDSNVLFRRFGGSTSRVGVIRSIFHLRHPTPDKSMMEATYILVHECLRHSDEAAQSQFTRFGFAGGFLCENEKWSRFHVVELGDIICHFAKTIIKRDEEVLVHVLPLNKVTFITFPHDCYLTVTKMMESYILPSAVA